MPSLMTHLKIGYEIGKKLNLLSYNYFLGLIAPDTPNLNGFGEKKLRWQAHLRKEDLNDWRQSLEDFYQENKNIYNKDFLIGYYIHILTDIVFDDFFYQKIKQRILKDTLNKKDYHCIMSKDMNEYYFIEYQKIKNILKSSDISYNINGLTKENILKWKEKNLNKNISKNSSKYLNVSIINELKEKVTDELYEKRNYNK